MGSGVMRRDERGRERLGERERERDGVKEELVRLGTKACLLKDRRR